MISFASAILLKDLRIIMRGGAGICQAFMLGLLLVFLFSLSKGPGETATPSEAATVFWLSSAFCQILVFGQLYALEEENSTREALALADAPIQGIWLGKACGGLLLLLISQAVFLPAIMAFLNQRIAAPLAQGAVSLVAVDLGMAVLGSLLGAAAQGQSGRDSLLSVIVLPLLAPLLMCGINLGAQALGAPQNEAGSWLGMAFAFDAVFAGAALLLFGFLYRGGQ